MAQEGVMHDQRVRSKPGRLFTDAGEEISFLPRNSCPFADELSSSLLCVPYTPALAALVADCASSGYQVDFGSVNLDEIQSQRPTRGQAYAIWVSVGGRQFSALDTQFGRPTLFEALFFLFLRGVNERRGVLLNDGGAVLCEGSYDSSGRIPLVFQKDGILNLRMIHIGEISTELGSDNLTLIPFLVVK